MAGNTFGTLFRITTFGESHGPGLGVVIDGCPPRLEFDHDLLATELARRKPGQSTLTTARNESESYEVLSGLFENKTTGAPICILVRNRDQRSEDYNDLQEVYRPSHADFATEKKFGIRDHRGSGRASARETIARVMGGTVAKMLLRKSGIEINAYVSTVADVSLELPYTQLNLAAAEQSPVRCPHEATAARMIQKIEAAGKAGDTVGGVISCVVTGMMPGLGEPVFDKLHADLGKAVLSINACKGFEIGSGFDGATRKGSEENDAFGLQDRQVRPLTNRSGGVQGGISNGADLFFRCAFKPVSSIRMEQQTVDKHGNEKLINIMGRHDPCVLPRAVVIVEAMAALTIVDHFLRHKTIS